MTVDFIAYHALTRPEAVAIIHDGQRITYADFHRDIRRFMKAAQELGLRPRSIAATSGPVEGDSSCGAKDAVAIPRCSKASSSSQCA